MCLVRWVGSTAQHRVGRVTVSSTYAVIVLLRCGHSLESLSVVVDAFRCCLVLAKVYYENKPVQNSRPATNSTYRQIPTVVQ